MAKNKWRFAIGTTSRVPFLTASHYFIADFDNEPFSNDKLRNTLLCCDNIILQQTQHGWHLYSDLVMSFEELFQTLKEVGADKSWIKIGHKRGYYFLADKSLIFFPWPVEHMVIHYDKKKT